MPRALLLVALLAMALQPGIDLLVQAEGREILDGLARVLAGGGA